MQRPSLVNTMAYRYHCAAYMSAEHVAQFIFTYTSLVYWLVCVNNLGYWHCQCVFKYTNICSH